jgi:hypothetical protein
MKSERLFPIRCCHIVRAARPKAYSIVRRRVIYFVCIGKLGIGETFGSAKASQYGLDFRHRSQHVLIAWSTSASLPKYRLWMVMRRPSFQTCPIGANCGCIVARAAVSVCRGIARKRCQRHCMVVPGVVQYDDHTLAA